VSFKKDGPNEVLTPTSNNSGAFYSMPKVQYGKSFQSMPTGLQRSVSRQVLNPEAQDSLHPIHTLVKSLSVNLGPLKSVSESSASSAFGMGSILKKLCIEQSIPQQTTKPMLQNTDKDSRVPFPEICRGLSIQPLVRFQANFPS